MRSLPGPSFGFRLIALSVVAGSGVFLPALSPVRVSLVLGILAGTLLGAAQYAAARWRLRIPGELFVLAQVGVWTFLVHVSNGQRSPLFIGYLLEVPLAAAQIGRRGAVLAATAGAVAYVTCCAIFHPPLDAAAASVAVGFLAISALSSWMLIGVFERQQRAIDASLAALQTRAHNLAEELRLLGDYLGSTLIAIDDRGRVANINPAGLELFGVDCGSVIGRPWQEVLKVDSTGMQAITRTLAEGIDQHHLHMILEPAKGAPLSARAELWVGFSAQGRNTYLLLDSRPPAEDEADPLRRLGEAVACVSHQIRNSIHALQGLASGLIVQDPEMEDRGSVRELLAALRSLGSLAENMLAMSGASRSPGETVPLSEVVSSAMVLSRRSAGHAQLSDSCPHVRVRGRRGELIHALFNLLDNAGRASPPGAPVRVRLRADATHAFAEIEDSGPGLPPGLEQARSPAPTLTGWGYGLLAARRFLEANGCDLSFERMAEGGTRCRIRLPRVSESGLVDASLAAGGTG